MLKRLQIKNYALIRELDFALAPGLTIMTGETGAGKSILIGALSLILGQRADTSVLKDKEQKCIVEGLFEVEGYGLEPIFTENELDYDNQVIFRREISPNGKSRAFVNDTPVNLKTLFDLGVRLIDIHSQHQNLELSGKNFQLMALDSFAGIRSLTEDYRMEYKAYKSLLADLSEAEEKAVLLKKEMDYFQFQYDQLAAARLQPGEQESLEHGLSVLTHAEEIKASLLRVSSLLGDDEDNVITRLKESMNQLGRISRFYPEAGEMSERLNSVYLEIADLSSGTSYAAEKMEVDPLRINQLNDRLGVIYSLMQKHHVADETELIRVQEDFGSRINNVMLNDEHITSLREKVNSLERILLDKAGNISTSRKACIAKFGGKVEEMLAQLGMPNARFQVEVTTGLPLSFNGTDEVNFLFTANRNGELNEISKVASGGELSRLMLSIKALISRSKALPTILFDEIDSGISGETADKMGNILKEVSQFMQVINITHLPQIAAKGDQHYMVYKEENEHDTVTSVRLLNREERISELAKMLSGEVITQAARLNAEELMN